MKDVLVRKDPFLGSCCCGCTLRTGTLIITIYDLIIGLLSLIAFAIIAASIAVIKDNGKYNWERPVDDLLDGIYGLMVFLTINAGIVVILASLAIHGARAERPVHLVPWLVGLPLRFLAQVIMSIVMFVKASDYAQALVDAMNQLDQQNNGGTTYYSYDADQLRTSLIGQGVGMIFEAALLLYFFLVVYSHFIELKNRRQGQRKTAPHNMVQYQPASQQPAGGAYPPA